MVREEDLATEIVGLWNKPYEFDDFAFKNAVYGEIKIKIKDDWFSSSSSLAGFFLP